MDVDGGASTEEAFGSILQQVIERILRIPGQRGVEQGLVHGNSRELGAKSLMLLLEI
jgi:hypothetical protein